MKNSLLQQRDPHHKFTSWNLFDSPSKAVVTIFIIVWLIGCTLLVLSMTDLFQESPFNRKHFISYLLIVGSTATVIGV